eukprot:TCONS_00066175-protein
MNKISLVLVAVILLTSLYGTSADICSIKTRTVDDCRMICNKSYNCRYFTWAITSKTCYLKGRRKRWSRRPHNGVISGSKTFDENIVGIDFNGGDMRSPC